MAAEEENTQRQRFYIELKPGETTIISWKKLLRKAKEKDQCGPHLSSSSTALETSRRAMGGNHDGGQYNDSVIRNKSAKHINRATSPGYIQPSECRVEMTKIECEKNDGRSSIKHAGSENLIAKATIKTSNLLDETVRRLSSPATVKDHRPGELQAFTVDASVKTYSKKSASFCSKSYGPPLKPIEDASVFSLKTMHNVQKKTQKISSEKIKVGVRGDSSDVVHQNFEGRCVPVRNSPTSGILLHDKKSSKSHHNDNSGGSWELADAISPGYKSSLKDSVSTKLAELWPEGVMDHHTLTEAISRAKSRRVIADKNLGRHVVDDVSRNPDQIPCQKRKVTGSIDNSFPIPSCPRKIAPKKASIEQPVLQSKSSCPLKMGGKLTLRQKQKQQQQVPEKTNLKVRFLLKQEHETLKSKEQPAKDALNHSEAAATQTCCQPT